MRFHTLVLEGDKAAERERKEERPPVSAKSAYLRRKWMEARPPLRQRSFFLCRMVEEELRGTDIDGSGKITICAHQTRLVPGTEKYICDRQFGISIYYLEPEEISALEEADQDAEPMVIWEILRNSFLDIARRNHCSEDTAGKIKKAFENIVSSHFIREERIDKLTKRAKDTGLTAQVYRVLSAETGEGWHLQITDRKGRLRCQAKIGENSRYVDRLGSRLYAKAEWRGDTFVILERFGKEVFRITADA